MGRPSGNYSVAGGHFFNENRQLMTLLQEQDAPIVDAILNTASLAAFTMIRRVMQTTFKNGSPFGKLRILEDAGGAKDYNFLIQGGDGSENDQVTAGTQTNITHKGPARFFVGGYMALLPSNRNWYAANVAGEPSIHSTITALSANTLTDSSAFFGIYGDSLVGRWVTVNIDDTAGTHDADAISGLPRAYEITGVTATSITLDLTTYQVYNPATDTVDTGTSPSISKLSDICSPGDNYRIELLPPSSTRIDSVFLDVYLDELSPTDDPILNRPIDGQAVKSANMGVIRQRIEYINGYDGDTNNKHYETQEDADGNVHHRVLLAIVSLSGANTDIDNADITKFFDDVFWGLTLGGLPATTTDSNILDSATSVGTDDSPGSYAGTPLKFPNLLLQSLGNISDDMNKAIQNMGDAENTAGLAAGTPGHGGAGGGRHVALVNNDEQAALTNRETGDVAGESNMFLTRDGHRGFAINMTSPGGPNTSGKLAEHAIQDEFETDQSGQSSIVDRPSGNGTPPGNASVTHATAKNEPNSVPPAPIIMSSIHWGIDPNTNNEIEFWVNTGMTIPASYSQSVPNLRADYTIIVLVWGRDSKDRATIHPVVETLGGLDVTRLKITTDNKLLVRVSVTRHPDETDAIGFGTAVFGVAKGPS